MTRIVTSTYRYKGSPDDLFKIVYKRPPRKRKAVPLEGPAIVRRGAAKPETPPPAANDDRQPVIVTARRRGSRFGDAPDLTQEEHRRRGDAADALFREMVRRAAGKD